MARYPKTESIGSIGSIILAILWRSRYRYRYINKAMGWVEFSSTVDIGSISEDEMRPEPGAP